MMSVTDTEVPPRVVVSVPDADAVPLARFEPNVATIPLGDCGRVVKLPLFATVEAVPSVRI